MNSQRLTSYVWVGRCAEVQNTRRSRTSKKRSYSIVVLAQEQYRSVRRDA